MNESKISIILPTYNERQTAVPLIKEIFRYCPDANIWVIDDNSPDDTAESVLRAFCGEEKVQVIIRQGNRGRGQAGREGFIKALKAGSEIIGEMDADFSHHPRFIPGLLEALKNADVAIGSRYLAGGGHTRRGQLRELVTRGARLYLRLVLGIRLTDPTSGFRFFQRQTLESIVPLLKADDPFIVTEVVFYLQKKRARMVEVPIYFYERKAGKSKLKLVTLLRYLWRVLCLRLRRV